MIIEGKTDIVGVHKYTLTLPALYIIVLFLFVLLFVLMLLLGGCWIIFLGVLKGFGSGGSVLGEVCRQNLYQNKLLHTFKRLDHYHRHHHHHHHHHPNNKKMGRATTSLSCCCCQEAISSLM